MFLGFTTEIVKINEHKKELRKHRVGLSET